MLTVSAFAVPLSHSSLGPFRKPHPAYFDPAGGAANRNNLAIELDVVSCFSPIVSMSGRGMISARTPGFSTPLESTASH